MGTILQDADLKGAVLTNANLTGTNLQGANLKGATVTIGQLLSASFFTSDQASSSIPSRKRVIQAIRD